MFGIADQFGLDCGPVRVSEVFGEGPHGGRDDCCVPRGQDPVGESCPGGG